MNKRYFNKEETNFIKENYPLYGSKFCADKLKKTPSSISHKAYSLGLKMSHENRRKLCIKVYAKDFKDYNVNPINFLDIKLPEVAYILGLLWADGNISFYNGHNVIQLVCTPPDSYEYLKIFNKIGIWKFYEYENKKQSTWKARSTIVTHNRIIAEFLKSKLYCSKSGDSANLILDCIPENLRYYWFRGLFDGDGCLYINGGCQQLSISSVYEQNWDFMEKIYKELQINYKIKYQISKKGHKSSYIRITNRKDCLKFLNYIYQNTNKDKCFLSRKYNKYLDLIEINNNMLTNPHSYNNFNLGKNK